MLEATIESKLQIERNEENSTKSREEIQEILRTFFFVPIRFELVTCTYRISKSKTILLKVNFVNSIEFSDS